jgi:hypothetical protein
LNANAAGGGGIFGWKWTTVVSLSERGNVVQFKSSQCP